MEVKQNSCWAGGLRARTYSNIEAKFAKEIEEVEARLREALLGTDTEIAMTYKTGEAVGALAWYFRQRGFTTNTDYSSGYGGWRLYASW